MLTARVEVELGKDGIATVFATGSARHQVIPLTIQCFLDPGSGGDKDVGLAGFDLLDGATVKVGQLSEFLLGNATPDAKSSQNQPTSMARKISSANWHTSTKTKPHIIGRPVTTRAMIKYPHPLRG